MKIQRFRRKQKERKARGTRRRLVNRAERPRLSVFRSSRFIYAQVIDDREGRTLAAASSREAELPDAPEGLAGKVETASRVGLAVAERAKKAGVSKVVFDRGPYKYHGRVRALADGARKGGLEF